MTGDRVEFFSGIRNAFEQHTLVKVSLGKYRGDSTLKRVLIAPLLVKGEERLGFRYQHQRQEISKNFSLAKGLEELHNLLRDGFFAATLFTIEFDLVLEIARGGEERVKRLKPTFQTPPTMNHNRTKNRRVDAGRPYLSALGITDANGAVRRDAQAKYRQIDKFIEILDGQLREAGLEKSEKISFRDFGSGKSYLTFALFDHLVKKGRKVSGEGIEQRPELVKSSQDLAENVGFEQLKFISGNIREVAPREVDVAIALHACDTATDDAILHAVQSKAQLIVLAPCCQKYVRKRIQVENGLKPVLRHGIHEEWFAATLTDSLRALWLEAHGYSAKIFEFVSQEYTHKNNMLVAVRSKVKKGAAEELARLKAEFGLADFYLDRAE